MVLQISAVLFNLTHLPPFDGYNALEPFLNPVIRMQVERFRDVAVWVILLSFWFVPSVSETFWQTVFVLSTLLG